MRRGGVHGGRVQDGTKRGGRGKESSNLRTGEGGKCFVGENFPRRSSYPKRKNSKNWGEKCDLGRGRRDEPIS